MTTDLRGALRAERRKLLTTRAFPGLLAGTVALTVVVAVGATESVAPGSRPPLAETQGWLFTALLTRILFVVLGVQIATDEVRHGTLTPSLLAVPTRGVLVTAQALTAAAAAVLLAAVAQATLFAVFAVTVGLPSVGTADAASMAGMLVGAALYGALGVGLGTVVPWQVAATVGSVVWLLLGEEVLRVRLGEAAAYLPGQAGIVLAVEPTTRVAPQAGAALVLGAWVLALAAAGAALLQRRDVA